MLDTSIVNVSLPHMQGSFSASVDEIAWVLTSYLVANGIMIPMTGWISSRFGRKRYFLTSVATFVTASAACGAARSLGQMVLFRLLQGAAGAAMIPSSQAILMETFPPEEQQMAMATWGVGLMVAPILGPTLGGWITDNWPGGRCPDRVGHCRIGGGNGGVCRGVSRGVAGVARCRGCLGCLGCLGCRAGAWRLQDELACGWSKLLKRVD